MHTLDETLVLLRTLKAKEESWPDFVRRCGVKSYTATQLQRIEAGEFKKGPFQFKLDALYEELLACQAAHGGRSGHGPPHSAGLDSRAEGAVMDQRRKRSFLNQFENFLDTLDSTDDMRAAMRGAIEAVEARHRGGLPDPGHSKHAPPGHKARG